MRKKSGWVNFLGVVSAGLLVSFPVLATATELAQRLGSYETPEQVCRLDTDSRDYYNANLREAAFGESASSETGEQSRAERRRFYDSRGQSSDYATLCTVEVIGTRTFSSAAHCFDRKSGEKLSIHCAGRDPIPVRLESIRLHDTAGQLQGTDLATVTVDQDLGIPPLRFPTSAGHVQSLLEQKSCIYAGYGYLPDRSLHLGTLHARRVPADSSLYQLSIASYASILGQVEMDKRFRRNEDPYLIYESKLRSSDKSAVSPQELILIHSRTGFLVGGDSGGTLICRDQRDGQSYLVGIGSSVMPETAQLVNTQQYRDWLLNGEIQAAPSERAREKALRQSVFSSCGDSAGCMRTLGEQGLSLAVEATEIMRNLQGDRNSKDDSQKSVQARISSLESLRRAYLKLIDLCYARLSETL